MPNFLREYLTFTKKERNGLLLLVSMIFGVLIYLNLDFNKELDDDTDMAEFESEMAALSEASSYGQSRKGSDADAQPESGKREQEHKKPYEFHEFDPNYVTDEEWKDMGLKQWQINGIRNYREKAGDFHSPEQFAKLNVVSDAFFEKVEVYLVFEEKTKIQSKSKSREKKKEEKPKEILSIEVNSATATKLMDLKGIGPAFSNRIVKYRNWLGGFLNLEQLLEVYGLEDSLYRKIIPFLTLDSSRITKIDINKVMIAELRKHPYVKWNVANAIVNYRDQHGAYQTVAEIKNTDLVSDELYRKIAPYFFVANSNTTR